MNETLQQRILRVVGGWNGKSGPECNVCFKDSSNKHWTKYGPRSAPSWDWRDVKFELMTEATTPTINHEWMITNHGKTIYSKYDSKAYKIVGGMQKNGSYWIVVDWGVFDDLESLLMIPEHGWFWDYEHTKPIFNTEFVLPSN